VADKDSIAQLLSQHPDRWNSPAEISAAVANVPDRTLRRWLGELVHEGVIERSGSRKGTRYRWTPWAKEEQRAPAVAEAGRSTTQIRAVFSPESEQLLKRIEAPLYTRPPVTYSQEWVA
jgi:DNA-binding IclR family transcriptional regulator